MFGIRESNFSFNAESVHVSKVSSICVHLASSYSCLISTVDGSPSGMFSSPSSSYRKILVVEYLESEQFFILYHQESQPFFGFDVFSIKMTFYEIVEFVGSFPSWHFVCKPQR